MADYSNEKAAQEIWQTLADTDVVMLADQFSGGLRARPMAVFPEPGEHAIWFVSDAATSKVDEVSRNPQVCLSAAKDVKNTYLSVSGHAAVVDDKAKLKELWNAWLDAWFEGPDDPKAVLIRVTPTEGELWDGDAKPLAAIKMLMASDGDRPNVGERKRAAL